MESCTSGEAFDRFWEDDRLPLSDSPYGQGSFGSWGADGQGDPVYEYTIAHGTDPRAAYSVSRGVSRDHWHLVGNDRITATAHNAGYVQFYDWGRGGKVVNRWCPKTRDYSGGFKFVATREGVFNTLWQGRSAGFPAGIFGITQRRVFGIGYFEKVTCCQGLTITERIEAPIGDDPVLISNTVIVNEGDAAQDLSVVEFWGYAMHQLIAAPLMKGLPARWFEMRRRRLNRRFVVRAAWDGRVGAVRIETAPLHPKRVPPPDGPCIKDYYPKTVFLAALDELPERFNGFIVDKEAFFGNGGPADPPGARGAADGRIFPVRSAYRANAVLAMRREVRLKPGQRCVWRYLYGYTDNDAIPDLVRRYTIPPVHGGNERGGPDRPRRPACEFIAPEVPWLHRELLWHSYYLQAGSVYSEYHDAHFVDQGSAYSFVHGFSGATRDFALFILPLVYLRPDLAKEMLRFCARLQHHRSNKLPYALVGHGCVRGYIVHNWSSDLDLFFLWALSEYLGATLDKDLLNEWLTYYPTSAGKSGTMLEHARAAFRHLVKRVGRGPNGLIRCGTGDWNDVLLGFSRFSPLTLWRGESALNAGLATVALPALAGVIEREDPSFAAELKEFAAGQARALESLWAEDWLGRGFLGYGNATLGKDRLFLDTQAFPVLGGVWEPARVARLFETIRRRCVEPQPAGALALWPPMKGPLLEPGSDTNGGTWAAVDSWLAWAWAIHDPQAAWDFYLSTTLAARAEAYPDVWYGVWSGPDSYNAHYHPRPGETFNLNATPMTDFPVMNMNRHSGILLDAIKLAGICPRDGVIVIDPRLPLDTFAIRLPLIGAAYLPNRHRGYYRPITSATFRFAVRPPAGLNLEESILTVNGLESTFTTDREGRIQFETRGKPGARITWEIRAR